MIVATVVSAYSDMRGVWSAYVSISILLSLRTSFLPLYDFWFSRYFGTVTRSIVHAGQSTRENDITTKRPVIRDILSE